MQFDCCPTRNTIEWCAFASNCTDALTKVRRSHSNQIQIEKHKLNTNFCGYSLVCLFFFRFESDGPIRYSMPDGQFGGRYGDLIDDTYDGVRLKNEYLTGGLGQLTDGVLGADNLKLNGGYEWIGWRATQNSSLQLQFEFEQPRNFSLARIHCHNQFRRSIECAQQVHVQFSWDGQRWSHNLLRLQLPPDHQNEQPRELHLPLQHRVGRHVRLQLRFAAKWMFISEVRFLSTPLPKSYQFNVLDIEPPMPLLPPPFRDMNSPLSTSSVNHDHTKSFDSADLTGGSDLFEVDSLSVKHGQGNQMLRIDATHERSPKIGSTLIESGGHNRLLFNRLPAVSNIWPPTSIDTFSSFLNQTWFRCSVTIVLVASFVGGFLVWQKFRAQHSSNNTALPAGLLATGLLQHGEKLQLMHKLNTEIGAALHGNGKQPYSALPHPDSNASSHEYAVPSLAHYEEIAGNQSQSQSPLSLPYKPPPPPPMTLPSVNAFTTSSFVTQNSPSPLLMNASNECVATAHPYHSTREYVSPGSNGSTGRGSRTTSTCSTFCSDSQAKRSGSLQPITSYVNTSLLSLLRNELHLPSISGSAVKVLQPVAGASDGQSIAIGRLSSKNCFPLNGSFANSKRFVLIHQPQGEETQLLSNWNSKIAQWVRLMNQLNRSNTSTDNFAQVLGFITPSPSAPIRLISEFGDCCLVTFFRQQSPQTLP